MKITIDRIDDIGPVAREEVEMGRFLSLNIDLGDGQRFSIIERDGVLEVHSVGKMGDGLVIIPVASNAVRIRASS
jgi:hypothetical protein